MKDLEALYEYAKTNGLHAVGALLRKYVLDGEPSEFCNGATTRSMCRLASMGVEGIPIEEDGWDYTKTKYGSDLYFHMWSGTPLTR